MDLEKTQHNQLVELKASSSSNSNNISHSKTGLSKAKAMAQGMNGHASTTEQPILGHHAPLLLVQYNLVTVALHQFIVPIGTDTPYLFEHLGQL
jgi:hypothetical protein